MALTILTSEWANRTIATYSIVRIVKGPVYIAVAGTTDENAGEKVKNEFFAAAGSVFAMRGPGIIEVVAWADARIPAAFADANWSVADHATAGRIAITVASLPTVFTGTVTSIQYQYKANAASVWGAWTDIGGTTAATYNVDGVANGVTNVRLRLVTTNGKGPAGNTENVTVA